MINNSKLSDDPLALVIPGHHYTPGDDINHISFPVTMCCDSSPMLMPATLYQLGHQHVYFSFRGPAAEIETTPSTVIEVQVNSEICPYWKSISKPLDILVQGVPLLRDRDVLLSHWSWKWLDNKKVVPPDQATRLHGYLRVPDHSLEKLLAISGPCGISMWPKSDSKVLDPRYSHIGVEAKGPDEVCAIAKATNHTLGFAQSANGKWLVRCRREHYPETRAILIPSGLVLEDIPIGKYDTQYVLQACTADLSCTSHAINTGLADLGWNAKVVKSMGPSAWLVTSKEYPPNPHISLSGKIMSVKQFDGNRSPFVQFSSLHPTMNPNNTNPWQHYVPTNMKEPAFAAPGPGPTASRFAELEKTLQAKIDERLTVMETKITKVSHETERATSGCLQKIDGLEQSVATKFMSVENTIANGQQQLLTQMKQLFESYAPCNEEPAKRPRKSDPQPPKEWWAHPCSFLCDAYMHQVAIYHVLTIVFCCSSVALWFCMFRCFSILFSYHLYFFVHRFLFDAIPFATFRQCIEHHPWKKLGVNDGLLQELFDNSRCLFTGDVLPYHYVCMAFYLFGSTIASEHVLVSPFCHAMRSTTSSGHTSFERHHECRNSIACDHGRVWVLYLCYLLQLPSFSSIWGDHFNCLPRVVSNCERAPRIHKFIFDTFMHFRAEPTPGPVSNGVRRSFQIEFIHVYVFAVSNLPVPWDKLQCLGEASNPGPFQDYISDPVVLPEHVFQMGTINPTGLHNNASSVASLGSGVWAVAETHATHKSQQGLRREFRSLGFNSEFCDPVPPVSQKCSDTFRGIASGVACISSFPIRSILDNHPSFINDSCRFLATHISLGPHCVLLVITIYAPPPSNLNHSWS